MNVPVYFLAEKPCVQVNATRLCTTEKGVFVPFSLLSLFRSVFSCRCGVQILLFAVEEFCAQTVSVLEMHAQGQSVPTFACFVHRFMRECKKPNSHKVNRHNDSFVSTDTHNRYALYAVAALTSVVIATLLGTVIHRLTKSGAAGEFSCLIKY